MPPAALSYDYVFAPVREDAELDLEATPTDKNPAVHIRRAWVLLQRKRPKDAAEACAAVLFATETPSSEAEAYARYLRAEAHAAMGKPVAYDLRRAQELALDDRLRERIEDSMPEASPPASRPQVATTSASGIDLHQRSEWRPGPTVRSRLFPMGKVYRLTIHHSAILLRSQSEKAAADQIRIIQRGHIRDEGYGDIGYHYLIDPNGRVWQGRELRYQGAHARGDNNRGNIGICLLGNFMRGRDGQRPTAAELEALEALVKELSSRHGIGQEQILCHSDLVNTDCPGDYLRGEVDRIARVATQSARSRTSAAE